MKHQARSTTKVYPNATMLLRPKTGLKDMVVELDPGVASRAAQAQERLDHPGLPDLPDVNLDEVLSSLDADTRDYLQLLIHGGGEGLQGPGADPAPRLQALRPDAARRREDHRACCQTRRANIRRTVHNFQPSSSSALAGKDKDLATPRRLLQRRVRRARRPGREPARDDRASCPARSTPRAVNLAKIEDARAGPRPGGPGAAPRRPRAGAVAAPDAAVPARVDADHQERRSARSPARRCRRSSCCPRRRRAFDSSTQRPRRRCTKVVNYLLNELAYNPPGTGVAKQGYLFWLAWANHNANTVFGNQDAAGDDPPRPAARLV